jgi:hypothetical protein
MAAKNDVKRGARRTPAKHDPAVLTVRMTEAEEQTKVRAKLAADGLITNATLVQKFSEGTFGDGQVSLDGCVEALQAASAAVHAGSLEQCETMLVAQASALNVIFCETARKARLNLGSHLQAAELYMRLALKAQAQCRATLEALLAMKNPPVVFARQANINHGGQQQVNNTSVLAPLGVAQPSPRAQAESVEALPQGHAPAAISSPVQGELLARGRHE